MGKPDDKPKKTFKISLLTATLCSLIFLIAIGASFWLGFARSVALTRKAVNTIRPIRENNQEYHFIYPLLYYTFGDIASYYEDKTLEAKINTYIQSQYKTQNAQSISVHFRDYSNSHWAGVNQNVQYHPGSMMKVIIMMGYFREAEGNLFGAAGLNKTLTYTAAINSQTTSVPFALSTNLTVGKSYSIDYLLQDMIGNSDNGAETLLLDNVNNTILNQAYVDLGITTPDVSGSNYTISPAQYSNFLRILYNSTYLTEQYSEQALTLMSQSSYTEGITAGVPAGVTVAQKYGERVDSTGNTINAIELSNCGIVYVPNHPYSLCIMTKKNITTTPGPQDETALANIIKNISSIVYNYTVSQ